MIPIDISKEEYLIIKNKTTKRSLKQMTNKFIKKRTNMDLLKFLDKSAEHLQRCGFCNRVTKINDYDVIIKNDKVYITNIKYKSELFNCYRVGECKGKLLNSNSKEYVMVTHGLSSLSEANDLILSRNNSPFYRHNHKTPEDYKKFQTRDKEWFGDEEKWNNYCKRQAYTNSLEYFQEKYGIEQGTIKYNNIQKQKDSSSFYHYINKYDDINEAIDKYNKKCKQSDSSSFQYMVNKYGKQKAKEIKEYRQTKEYYIEKYGVDEGIRIFNYRELRKNKITKRASKESLIKLFLPLIDVIKTLNIPVEYFVGTPGNKEYYLKKTNNGRINNYFFDFAIPSIKLIVEYHGSRWHYNTNYDYSYLLEDKCWSAFPSIDNMKTKDENKRQFILSQGFHFIEVFDTDNIPEKITEIINYIKESYEKTRNEN